MSRQSLLNRVAVSVAAAPSLPELTMNRQTILSLATILISGVLFGCKQSTEPPTPVTPGPISWKRIAADLIPSHIIDLGTTPDGAIVATSDEGVYISHDQGNEWKRIREGRTRGLAINGRGEIFIAQEGTLLRSGNEGATWESLLTDNNISDGVILALDDGTIFVTGNSVIFRSVTNGTTWNRINSIPTGYGLFTTIFAPTPSTIIVASNGFGIFRSTDKGVTWKRVGEKLITIAQAITSGRNGEIYAVGPNTDNNAPYTRTVVWRSDDNGATWSNVGNCPEDIWAYQVTTNKHGHMFLATSVGVLRSGDNGISWEIVTSGMEGYRVFSMTFDAKGYLYATSNIPPASAMGAGLFKTNESTE